MKRSRLEKKCATQHTHESDNDKISGLGLNCDPFLPDEIIIEILSWLSVDSLVRVRCVCKSWCAMIQKHNFIEKHKSRARAIVEFAAKNGIEESYNWLCVQGGLLIERSNLSLKYRIRNPSTKQKIDLPNPRKDLLFMSMFLLSTSNDYKAVYIHHKEGTTTSIGAKVLTIGTDRTWRSLDIPNLKSQRREMTHISIAQVYYIIGMGDYEVICVDMETESYTSVEIPKGFFPYWKDIQPLDWRGKLALASVMEGKMIVWVLENYKKQKWANKKFVIPLDSIMEELSIAAPDNLIPIRTKGNLLWFNDNFERQLAYNICSNRVSTVATAPPGQKIQCIYRPSLEHIKGMTPVEI